MTWLQRQIMGQFRLSHTRKPLGSIHLLPGQTPKRGLLDLPEILAPSPLKTGEMVRLAISQDTIRKLASAGRRTSIFEAWAHLVGEMPPVNNAELVRRTEHPHAKINTIRQASGCFKGVKRRYDHDDYGKDIYVYSIATPHTVRWKTGMTTVAQVLPCPDLTVLTVQVRSAETLQSCQEGVWGTITKWEFVSASPESLGKPDAYENKYDSVVW